MTKFFPIHVRTVTGLEEILAGELTALGAKDVQIQNRLVTCTGDKALLYKLNVHCRTAIRVLRPLAAFPAGDEKALYDGVRKINWGEYLSAGGTLAVDANVHSSFSTHSLFLSQLVKDAVVDQFRDQTGRRPSVDLERPDLRIVVSLFQDQAQIYVDSSGDSLHKRGYRKKAGEAPLSETLAAGIILHTGWDGTTPLLDPMCGSGTLLIEAGLIARNFAPGLLGRRYGFQNWPDYDRDLFDDVIENAKGAVRADVTPTIVGTDLNPETVDIARENVAIAGLDEIVKIDKGDFFGLAKIPQPAGTLVMNPPYDERLPVDNIAELYQTIGDRLKQGFGGWSAFVLAGNLEGAKYFGLRTSQRITLFNGSIECRLLKYELRAKANSEVAPEGAKAVFIPRPLPTVEHRPEWKAKAEVFANRLRKNFKHYAKWAKREGISCYRIYDRDIPELHFIVDLYGDRLHFAEVERNYDHSPIEHKGYMQLMVDTAAEILGIPPERVYFKKRKPQKSGGFQYVPHAETGEFIEVAEGGHRFLTNLADYLDVGLFLDHRTTRAIVEKEANGKDFLNLFAYTGSFTVYAAAGGAKSTTTVDTNRTYLDWAEENLRINNLAGPNHQFVRSDTADFLQRTTQRFDICVVDPPTRSVNRSAERVFDVQQDHVRLLEMVLRRMRPGGKVFFSTNYRTFKLDDRGLARHRGLRVSEITAKTIPLDFQRKPSHRCWLLELQ